jgi:hypothetical protein
LSAVSARCDDFRSARTTHALDLHARAMIIVGTLLTVMRRRLVPAPAPAT